MSMTDEDAVLMELLLSEKEASEDGLQLLIRLAQLDVSRTREVVLF